jgi:hypothetical protein
MHGFARIQGGADGLRAMRRNDLNIRKCCGSSSSMELPDFDPYGIETQIFLNGELLQQSCRFTVRALAMRWAELKAGGDS